LENNVFSAVALNHQTNDKHMDINEAMFEQNGNVGYVPKPKILLEVRSLHSNFHFC